ncbi:prepilin-type N-terminal cleavage/methylation domain-containing protein [Planctomycetota bacterium]
MDQSNRHNQATRNTGGRAGWSGDGGFTLVEVLVTMAVVGMLLVMVGSIVTGFLQHEKKATATLTRERVGAAILELISRDVQGVYAYDIPGAFVGADERTGPGDADTLEFLTTREPAASGDEDEDEDSESRRRGSRRAFGEAEEEEEERPEPLRLTKVGYFLKDSQSAPGYLTLFRYEDRYTPPPRTRSAATAPGTGQTGSVRGPFDEKGDPVVFEIYNRLRSFNVRYLDSEGSWLEFWRASVEVPRAIEITLEVVPEEAEVHTGYESAVEQSRNGGYQTIIGLPIQLPEPNSQTP